MIFLRGMVQRDLYNGGEYNEKNRPFMEHKLDINRYMYIDTVSFQHYRCRAFGHCNGSYRRDRSDMPADLSLYYY